MTRIPVPRKEIADYCHRNGIRRLAFFGSVLREDFGPESDVDVLVEFEPNVKIGFFRLYALEQELGSLLGGKKVDLNTPQMLSRYFRARVMTEAEVMYEAA